MIVYNKDKLHSHLLEVLETKLISPFPISQTRSEAKIEKCFVFYICRLSDNGENMICCDNCEEWFHFKCLNTLNATETAFVTDNNWYCASCKK